MQKIAQCRPDPPVLPVRAGEKRHPQDFTRVALCGASEMLWCCKRRDSQNAVCSESPEYPHATSQGSSQKLERRKVHGAGGRAPGMHKVNDVGIHRALLIVVQKRAQERNCQRLGLQTRGTCATRVYKRCRM